jgi:hypothetical protein
MGRPADGRTRRVRVERLWMRDETVPQQGQGTVGDVVRRGSVICSATSTPSTWTWGRARKMLRGMVLVLQKRKSKRKNVQLVTIPHFASARVRKSQQVRQHLVFGLKVEYALSSEVFTRFLGRF